ncbi:MAG: sulfoxide reductase heme-binding subunit YedZ [Acidobacteriales bacterium]|nr:sulfoxide reductase heme-binding subunit YedZ [Terriglobales bacterium]
MKTFNPPIKWIKPPIFFLCLVPFLHLVWRGFHEDLGANPVEAIQTTTGQWTLNFLVITLAISPLRRALNQPWLIRFRRMFGLFAFFYVCLHFTSYIWLDQSFDVRSILKDVAKRPFITAGFTAFVLLIPLALTSTTGWIRRMGGARWRQLHSLIYISAIAGGVHYYWKVKSDVRLPVLYLSVIGLLLAIRVVSKLRARRATADSAGQKIENRERARVET